ncbi:hypothetical protein C1893_29230 [Pseudomonas sp. MPR-ANC1]|nr:hypothetical protein C1893_29230 [Pseudomonas sp. MPR-ANC1]
MGGDGCHCLSLDRDSESLDILCNSPVPHPVLIVPTLCVVTHPVTLRVTLDAERPWRHSHAERGNDQ